MVDVRQKKDPPHRAPEARRGYGGEKRLWRVCCGQRVGLGFVPCSRIS